MAAPDDLAGRIARLERLLDGLEGSRTAQDPSSLPDHSDPVNRLREVIAIVEQRAKRPDVDEGDRIAMRALLEQFRSLVADIRREALGTGEQLEHIGGALDGARRAWQVLEDAR